MPSLAALRLDTVSTDVKRKRDTPEDGASSALLPPLRLTGLPRSVIDVMVTQAALAARKDAEPALTICLWMRNFCRSVNVQDMSCDDHWFKLALQTFGVPTDATKLPCMIKYTKSNADGAKPTYMTWKDLFGNACDALTHESTAAEPGVWGRDVPMPKAYVDMNATQRELDFEVEHVTETWVAGDRYYGDSLSVIGSRKEARAKVKELFEQWVEGKHVDIYMRKARAGHLALLTILLLRGAELMAADKYVLLDSRLYTATRRFIDREIDRAEARKQVREALEEGASILQTLRAEETYAIFFDPMLLAIQAGDGVIINLLLDYGWEPLAPIGRAELQPHRSPMADLHRLVEDLYLASVRNWRGLSESSFTRDWAADDATTERLIRSIGTKYAQEQIKKYVNGEVMFMNMKGYLWERLIDRDNDLFGPPVPGVNQAALKTWIRVTRYEEQSDIEAERAARSL